MGDSAKIADLSITTAPNGPAVKYGDLWRTHRCVVVFFRRFGWPFCRLAAKEISALQPIFKENNVRLIGVGVEPLGVEEFIEGKFFDGELFLDNDKQTFKKMGFGRFSFLSLFSLFRSKKWTDANSMAKKMNLGGNLKGDGFQLGGALIVDVGGKTLYSYVQEDAADHIENEKVLQVLGIDAPVPHGIEQS